MRALSGELTIDLSAVQKNYLYLDGLSAVTCETAAAVKANAYGLGLNHVAPALYDVGARRFFVATLAEAVQLRGLLKGAAIYVLNGFVPSESQIYFQHNLVPVLNSVKELESYRKFIGDAALPAIMHFDTGMNRLGFSGDDVVYLSRGDGLLQGLNIHYVMSHFASADEMDNPFTRMQYECFLKLSDSFSNIPKSLSNSAGLFHGSDYHFDLVRPGVAIYGGKPTDNLQNPMRQVVSLNVPVLQVRSVKSGDICGYNETYSFDSDGQIAIVSCGYADGLLRSLSNSASLYYKGYELPVRGRVSMDLVICDLCHVPDAELPQSGDMVEVIGAHQSVDDLAQKAGTISYEVLTSLGSRYSRSYVE